MFKEIIKRDGRIVDFDSSKITNAIFKAGHATGEFGMDIAKKLTIKVLDLATEIIKNKIPTVEEIQDIVEEVLLNSPYKRTAKAYIIYREQHARIREITTKASVDLVDQYLKQSDWRVKENSNMGFSLQGLNNYVSSEVTKTYWLNSIYPPEIRKAYVEGDFHIHDLGCLSVYCVGWDLQDLLLIGFKGAEGKVESSPAKHFGSALGQIVNFFYTLQGECYSADTQVLTYSGWKYFYQLNEEDKIFTLNIQTNEIELQKPVRFYEFDYDGELYNFKSKKIDLLVTPNHNMLVDQYSPNYKGSLYKRKFVKAKDFNPNEHFIPKQAIWKGKKDEYFVLPGIEIQQYSGLTKKYKKIKIESKKIPMDVWLKFFGFYLAEGTTTIRKRNRVDRKKPYYEYQVRIFQNKGSKSDEFEEEVLKKLPFRYIKKISGKKIEFVIYNKQLFSYLAQFGKSEDRFIPQEIKDLDKNQLKILTEWIMKGNGYKGNGNIEYYTKSERLANDFQEIILKLGFTANIYEKNKENFKWYVVSNSRSQHFKFSKKNIRKVPYKGKVYCVEVPNHTLYVRRNGKACWCGNSAGAQAFSNFDTLLAPFVRYDGLNYKEVKQAIQEFLFNLNVPTRTGFQTPFTNLTFDLKVPDIYKEQPIIVGGKIHNITYSEFQKEMDMINKAFFEVMLEGDAKGRVFTFPIPTYNITKDFDWDNEILEGLWEMTGKYGIPYFSNFINSDMRPDDVRSMCCRLRLQLDELKKRGGGLFGANPQTGSIGVVTINLPRIGYLSKTKEEFKKRLSDLMELAKESLEIKRKVLERFTDEGLYPYSRFYLRNVKERFGKYWTNHFSTIGIVGMNEACLNLFGKDLGSDEGIDFAVEIMEFMREKLIKFQESTGNNYNLEATPAEGTSYRLARIDKNKYPDIIVANETEYRKGAEPFYTNSTHLPVNYTDDIFELLEKQDKLQSLYTGGTVVHIFVGERIDSKEGIKKLVKIICENFTLPYFTITPTFSVCPNDGYLNGQIYNCPKCGSSTEIYSRIVGYLRPISQWNKGKFEEFKIRKTFVIK